MLMVPDTEWEPARRTTQRHSQLVRGVEAAGADGRLTMIGTSLGPYKIIEQLGAGGMGEVWEAEAKLNRRVALKVLPGSLFRCWFTSTVVGPE